MLCSDNSGVCSRPLNAQKLEVTPPTWSRARLDTPRSDRAPVKGDDAAEISICYARPLPEPCDDSRKYEALGRRRKYHCGGPKPWEKPEPIPVPADPAPIDPANPAEPVDDTKPKYVAKGLFRQERDGSIYVTFGAISFTISPNGEIKGEINNPKMEPMPINGSFKDGKFDVQVGKRGHFIGNLDLNRCKAHPLADGIALLSNVEKID